MVAFPLPDLPDVGLNWAWPIPTEWYGASADYPEDFMNFHTEVDGRPVRMHVEQRAFRNGVEYTGVLRKIGVKLHEASVDLAELPTPTARQWIRQGVIGSPDKTGKASAHWRLKTTFWWRQVFPAGREVRVTHRYTPSVGNCSPIAHDCRMWHSVRSRKPYCATRAQTTAEEASAKTNADFSIQYLAYVLKTGARSHGPIRDFHLVIESAADVVATCFPGLRATAPGRLEVSRRNFVPRRDLHVYLSSVDEPSGEPETPEVEP